MATFLPLILTAVFVLFGASLGQVDSRGRGGRVPNPCWGNQCPPPQHCVPSPKACFAPPCPQYDCVGPEWPDWNGQNPCWRNQCPPQTFCVPSPKYCYAPPCPQYDCIPIDQGHNPCLAVLCRQGTVCVPTPRGCIDEPCPQFDCVPVYPPGPPIVIS